MGQKKLFRFNEIKGFPNVLEYPENIAGKWKDHFGNGHPIVLELACGRGEYSIGLAVLHPQNNYIGSDIKGNRIYIGAKHALENNLRNAAFLRTQIEKLDEYFSEGEVSEIWITFPDPQLRLSTAKKRLTHPRFLRLYQKFLKPGGIIHLKTDSPDLHRFTSKVIELYGLTLLAETSDAYASAFDSPELRIRTHYESLDIAQSNRIHYIKFQLPAVIPNHDEVLNAYLESLRETV